MKKFVLKILLLSLPLFLILVGVNYVGDSANLYKVGYELKMAEIVTHGRYVTNVDNYDERIFQKECIEHMVNTPEIVILGSSRAMQLNNNLIESKSIFNSSVSGASLEDYIAIFQLYKNNKRLPKKIIIDVEPYLFNVNHNQIRWKSIQKYYYQFRKENKSTEAINKYKELISLSYFQSSIKKFFKVLSGKGVPKATCKKYNKSFTKLNDGTIVYDDAYREASVNEVEAKVASYLAGDLYSIEDFNSIDENIYNEFLKLVNEIKKNNITVEFFLCPLHPKVYVRVTEKYPMVLKTEDLITKFALYNNIVVYGTFNPIILGLDRSSFYDGLHLKEFSLEKILHYRR